MEKKITINILCFLFVNIVFAQKIQTNDLNCFFQNVYQKVNQNIEPGKSLYNNNSNQIKSGAFQNISKYFKSINLKYSNNRSSDTLFVGVAPNDSLIISGTYFHNGPILVLPGGVLRFKNANATIIGDVYLFNNSLLAADSSYLYFPQQFFYQRSLVLTGNSKVQYRNTTLDHSGLSHNILLTDSSSIDMFNVTNVGFTTWGLYKKTTVNINKINEAGEFVTTENTSLTFKNAKTILLWHQIPKTGVVNYSFGNGDTVKHYVFNTSQPGIVGIQYKINVDSCNNVMWGLMPAKGSDVTIYTDSKYVSEAVEKKWVFTWEKKIFKENPRKILSVRKRNTFHHVSINRIELDNSFMNRLVKFKFKITNCNLISQ